VGVSEARTFCHVTEKKYEASASDMSLLEITPKTSYR
jgi:hypothetical protein